tara:strand:+ start:8507 stop:9262 length:756 start_codon:yes stop_codon:yes gene_type:complete
MKLWLFIFLISTKAYALRIVSTSPAISEMITRLGAEAQIVGRTPYCLDAKNAAKVGTALQLDYEKVISLKPDLVIIQENTPGKTSKDLKALGLKTIVIKIVSLSDLFEGWRVIAKTLNKDESEIIKIQSKIIKTKMPGNILFKLGGAPKQSVLIAGSDSFYADLIQQLGGQYASKSSGWPSLSSEELRSIVDTNTRIVEIATQQDRLWHASDWQRFCSKCKIVNWVDARAAYPGPAMVESIIELFNNQVTP